LNLEEILTLTEDGYAEQTWCAVGPQALPFSAIGVHSYNSCGDLEATDACLSLGPRVGMARWP
jgi:hypothetical protein